MQIRIKVNDLETLSALAKLTPEQYMRAWSTVVKQAAEKNLRNRIGGDFGHDLARSVVQIDETPLRHDVYVGGENGYIAEHVHTGGVIKPKNRKYLAIPVDRSVKGLFAREVPDLFPFQKSPGRHKRKGPDPLFIPIKRKNKLLFVLKKQTKPQIPRPWWLKQDEADEVTTNFFDRIFGN